MKYLVFYGSMFYPSGGWEDFQGEFDTLQEAHDFIMNLEDCCNWAHIVNNGKIIRNYYSNDENETWKLEDNYV